MTQVSVAPSMKPNGPVVWEVAVCVGAGVVFAKVPVDGREFSRPDVIVKVAKSR